MLPQWGHGEVGEGPDKAIGCLGKKSLKEEVEGKRIEWCNEENVNKSCKEDKINEHVSSSRLNSHHKLPLRRLRLDSRKNILVRIGATPEQGGLEWLQNLHTWQF